MTNEDTKIESNEEEIEINLDEDTEEETPKADEKVEKPTESLEARKARLERQLAQTLKKMGVPTETKEVKTSTTNDLGEKAYLIANGIKSADEMAFTKQLAKETGKDIETLLETTYFQTELSAFRTSKATPKGNGKANNSSVDTVEYWIAKGELPPANEVELRRKVVNARMKKEDSKGQFYNS
jgi:hypothetical protein